MTLTFATPAELAANRGTSILIYGAPGAGKTTLAGQAPAPLFVDVDGGTRSLVGVPGVQVYRPDTWNDIRELYSYLLKSQHTFQSVVFDSLTELYRLALVQAQKDDPRPGGPQLQHHGAATDKIVQLVRGYSTDLCAAGLHVLFTAPEIIKAEQGDTSGRLIRQPSLPNKALEGTHAAVESLVRLVADRSGKRTAYLRGTPLLMAKFRAPAGVEVPVTLDNPTMDQLLALTYYQTEENI